MLNVEYLINSHSLRTEYNKLQLNSNKPHVATGTRCSNCCENAINYKKNNVKSCNKN